MKSIWKEKFEQQQFGQEPETNFADETSVERNKSKEEPASSQSSGKNVLIQPKKENTERTHKRKKNTTNQRTEGSPKKRAKKDDCGEGRKKKGSEKAKKNGTVVQQELSNSAPTHQRSKPSTHLPSLNSFGSSSSVARPFFLTSPSSSSSSTPSLLPSSPGPPAWTPINSSPFLPNIISSAPVAKWPPAGNSFGKPAKPSPEAPSSQNQLQIQIVTQPPLKTVYQRILKPFPTISLLCKPPGNAAQSNTPWLKGQNSQDHDLSHLDLDTLFVEASLRRGDNGKKLPECIDGICVVRFERINSYGVFATFKKLKILSTSQQLQGTLLRLEFTLKRYSGNSLEMVEVPNCSIVSHPIEVFSHTQYLYKDSSKGKKSSIASKPFIPFLPKGTQQKSNGNSNSQRRSVNTRQDVESSSVSSNDLIAVLKSFKEKVTTV